MARPTNNKTDEGTRQKILNAAWTLFQKNSTSFFTLQELADRIDLHYTVLYHYFKNKSDLETEIIEGHSAGRSERLAEVCVGPGDSFNHLVKFIYAEMKQPPSNLFVRRYDVFAEPYRSRVNKAFDRNALELARVVQQGMEDGSITECNPRLIARLILRILNRYANQNEDVLSQAGLTASGLAEQISLFIANGIVVEDYDLDSLPRSPCTSFPRLHTSVSNLDLLLRTLIRALNERGYDSTSIPEVAASIGISKTSFYRFAASKEELLYLAAHRSLSLLQQVRQMARAVGRDPLDTLLHVVYFSRYLLQHEPGPPLRPAIFEFLSDEHARVAWDIFNAGRFDMIDILNAGVAEGQFRPVDAIAVQPMLTSVMNTAFRSGEPAFMDEVAGFMLRGIATRRC